MKSMKKMVVAAIILLMGLLSDPVRAAEPPTLSVPGTGDSQILLRSIAKAFHRQEPQLHIEVPDSIGSGGGIRMVLIGKATIARTARLLKAEEKDKGLEEFPFAHSPVVFVVHPSVTGITTLSTDEIIGIYSGRYTNWQQLGGPDHRLYVIDREGGDSARTVLENKLVGCRELQSRGKVFYSTPETAEAIAGNRFTIGFLPMSVARSHELTILAVDGVYPGEAEIESGVYPYTLTFNMVSKGLPQGNARRFMEFLNGDATRQLIRQAGLLPVKLSIPEQKVKTP